MNSRKRLNIERRENGHYRIDIIGLLIGAGNRKLPQIYEAQIFEKRDGAPGENRTPNLLVRSQALYPIELRAHPARKASSNYNGNRIVSLSRISGNPSSKTGRKLFAEFDLRFPIHAKTPAANGNSAASPRREIVN
jgi:hypothetical protein